MFKRYTKLTQGSPLLTRLVVVVLLPLLVAGGLLLAKFRHSLPTDGALQLTQGVTAPVSIRRDAHGVPHIEARADNDAYYAIGYVHAQDRLWQLEIQRRIAQGRLSEVFGRSSVQRDIWFRTLGLYDAARSAWPALSKEAQASLTAYTAGVNAGRASLETLPPEFRMLSVQPEPWTVYDSLAWIKMFALNLGGNFNREMGRYLAGQSLDAEHMAVLFPDNSIDSTLLAGGENGKAGGTAASGQLASMLAFQHKELTQGLGLGGRGVGSNAWVVSGKHSAGGAALLANDPHLNLQIPSIWYVVSAKGKTLDVGGMSLVGLPAVIFGHNKDIAWGGTNMMADAQDLYFERSDPANPGRYAVNGDWQAYTTRSVSVSVRSEFPDFLHPKYEPVTVQVRASRHGPIVSDMFKVFDQPVALRWTALDAGDTSYEAFFRLNHAADWGAFKQAMQLHVAPAMNMVYADRQGNIGYLGAGRVPLRGKGNGSVPSPGWNDDYAWSGFIPADKLPQIYNPPSGFIVSANNSIVGEGYPYFISQDWASPARARRIEQLLRQKLAANKPLTMADMQQMQGDTLDLEAQEILPELLKLAPANDAQRQAMTWLRQWNGDMQADSQAAAIFHVWMRHLREQLFSAQFKGYWNKAEQGGVIRGLSEEIRVDTLRRILAQQQGGWCAPAATAGVKACQDVLRTSLQAAIDEIYELKGDHSMDSWHWGKLQTALYGHTPFSQTKPLDGFFERRVGSGGSENTINVAASSFETKKGYKQHLGAGFRQVIRLQPDGVLNMYMNSTGQSGNLLSRHYDDMVEPFAKVQFVPLNPAVQSGEAK
ncbi:penicillin acylase family protein [Janthinobacterium sp. SUN118]|uniref:penicillin acylase family protein n=1 Tax=Janthinobacterium sp. SUN118 TaxID=3004100 RepID=UPI0025B094A1|nr:penicillin acylase family protein [Janthinobacterium sp. SUN118]MDN2712795.1 penicillin acylase family protein [Janthinobacterium sp. SUN118]